MAIGSDYPRPITVNGYVCRNCDDVANAKRNIDPAAPDLELAAVTFGGSLSDRRSPAPLTAFRLLDRTA